jgi:hypothetical protein
MENINETETYPIQDTDTLHEMSKYPQLELVRREIT